MIILVKKMDSQITFKLRRHGAALGNDVALVQRCSSQN